MPSASPRHPARVIKNHANMAMACRPAAIAIDLPVPAKACALTRIGGGAARDWVAAVVRRSARGCGRVADGADRRGCDYDALIAAGPNRPSRIRAATTPQASGELSCACQLLPLSRSAASSRLHRRSSRRRVRFQGRPPPSPAPRARRRCRAMAAVSTAASPAPAKADAAAQAAPAAFCRMARATMPERRRAGMPAAGRTAAAAARALSAEADAGSAEESAAKQDAGVSA